MNELVRKYIAYQLAVTVFKQDLEKFNSSAVGNLYLDMIESIIDRMQQDYFDLKKELLTKHHIDVKKVDSNTYLINKEEVKFSSDELKQLTEELMSEYMIGDKSTTFKRQQRTWPPRE